MISATTKYSAKQNILNRVYSRLLYVLLYMYINVPKYIHVFKKYRSLKG